jgi:hypothetical protein
MADYPITVPADLTNIDVTTPADSEQSSKLASADRQTRSTFKDVMLKEHNSDGTHKALTVTNIIPDNSITGAKIKSSASDDTQRAITTNHLKDLSVTTAKLAAEAVTDAKLASDPSSDASRAVGTDHIKDLAVTTGKLADVGVTTGKVANNAITSAKLSSHASDDSARAVQTDAIKDLAVTTGKVAALAITPAKLGSFGNLKIPVGNGSSNVEAASIGGDITATLNSGVLELRVTNLIQTIPYAVLQETTTPGGAAAAATWNNRGTLSELSDTQNLVTISGGIDIVFGVGTYLIRAAAVAYSVGKHQIRLRDATNNTTYLLGAPMIAPAGVQSESLAQGVVVIATAGTKLRVQHYTELAHSTNGLGLSSGSGETQPLCTIEILKLQST